MKKVISCLALFFLLLPIQSLATTEITPQVVQATDARTSVASGTVGTANGAPTWHLYENGRLEVTGGHIVWTNQTVSPWHIYREQIEEIFFTDTITTGTSLVSFFRDLTHVEVINGLEYFDTSNVTNMSGLFRQTPALTHIGDISNWDTSRVTNMYTMFEGTTSLTSLDLSNWNVSSVTNMGRMFESASSLTNLDLSSWNTANVTRMESMFRHTHSLLNIAGISHLNTSSVTTMVRMFDNARLLRELDLSHWDTGNVTNMTYLFFQANGLAHLNVSGWNTEHVNTFGWMFEGTNSLESLDLSNWNTVGITATNRMFFGANSLRSLNLSGWNTENISNMSQMFTGTTALRSLTLGEQFHFTAANAALQNPPNNSVYSGLWRNVAEGSPLYPMGTHLQTAANLMSNPSFLANTWVWDTHFSLSLSSNTVTIDDENLNALSHIGGTASGVITMDASSLPSHVSLTLEGETITITGVRPAYNESVIRGTFEVPIMRDGLHQTLTIIVHLTPQNPPSRTLELPYMFGDTQGNFMPNKALTRAEAAAIVTRIWLRDFEIITNTLPPDVADMTPFSDVLPNDWFYYYVLWAYHDELILGFDEHFRPNDPITREEFTALFMRTGNVVTSSGAGFSDAESISRWAKPYIHTAYHRNLIFGDEDGNFHPQSYIQRADAATALNRLLGRVDSNSLWDNINLVNLENARNFPDVADNAWYFPSVVSASNKHFLERNADGIITEIEILP